MHSSKSLKEMESWLKARRSSKTQILKEGGVKAAVHSWDDITLIDFALKRLEHGQFGLCTNCGVLIEQKRLEFRPETPFCSDCIKVMGRKQYRTLN